MRTKTPKCGVCGVVTRHGGATHGDTHTAVRVSLASAHQHMYHICTRTPTPLLLPVSPSPLLRFTAGWRQCRRVRGVRAVVHTGVCVCVCVCAYVCVGGVWGCVCVCEHVCVCISVCGVAGVPPRSSKKQESAGCVVAQFGPSCWGLVMMAGCRTELWAQCACGVSSVHLCSALCVRVACRGMPEARSCTADLRYPVVWLSTVLHASAFFPHAPTGHRRRAQHAVAGAKPRAAAPAAPPLRTTRHGGVRGGTVRRQRAVGGWAVGWLGGWAGGWLWVDGRVGGWPLGGLPERKPRGCVCIVGWGGAA